MSFFRQLILSGAVLFAALYIWIVYVPSSHPTLERLGVAEFLGIEISQTDDQGGGRRRGFGGGVTRVIVEKVVEQTLADAVRAIGDGEALRAVTVRSKAVGLVTDILVAAGGRVEAASTIARLEDEAETIARERAQLMVEDARDTLERLTLLRGNVTKVRLREAEVALRTAELELRKTEFELEQREITAPIAGWIGIIDTEVGDRVAAQDVLATITDRSLIVIDFRVPERVIPYLSIGKAITVTPLGLRDTVLEGEISAIDTIVDRASRTLRVQGRVKNDDDMLRVGMAFQVDLSFPGETLLSIPPLALQWSSEGAFVWAVRDEKAERVAVEIRQRNAESIMVDAKLQAGEMIVVEGVQNLRPGSTVEIANPPEAARASMAPARL